MKNNIEKEAKRQALREKFEKEYAPKLQGAKKETEKETVVEVKPVEEIKNEIVLPESKDMNELLLTDANFKKRVDNKLKDWEAFIKEHEWLNLALDLENKDTEVIVSNYRKYISDNPKNIELIVDALSTEGTLSLIQANTGSGKTNITNTVMNILRENKKKELADFINTIKIDKETLAKKEYSGLKSRIDNKVTDIQTKNAVKLHNIKKRGSSLTKKDLEYVEKLQNEINEAVKQLKENFIKEKLKSDFFTYIDDIDAYITECGIYVLTIILCPNKIQNVQNQEEEEYTFKAIVGNGKNQIELEADTNYSMVYDKVYDLISLLEKNPNIRIKMVVDEGHSLVKDAIFRNDAVSGIVKCVEKVISLKGSVAFITATTDSLSYFAFDRIISFLPEEEPHNYEKAVIYENRTKEDMVSFAARVIPTLETPQIRLNSYKGIAKLDKVLTDMGLNGLTVTSKDKEIGLDGKYKNAMYENITKKSALPKADYYIQTQILDAGTNIKGILQEDGSIKQENITPVYVMKDSRDMNFDSQEQFIARRRYAVNGSNVVIIKPNKGKKNKILSKKEIFNEQMEQVNNSMEVFKAFYNQVKCFYMDKPKEVVVANIRSIIETQVLEDGKKLHMECIYFDENTMDVEYNKLAFWKIVYEKYMEQFYYNDKEYIKALTKKFNMPVEVFKGELPKIEINFESVTNQLQEKEERVLSNLSDLGEEDIAVIEEIVKKDKTVNDIEDKEFKEKVNDMLSVPELKKVFKNTVKMNAKLSEVVKRMVRTISINESLETLKIMGSDEIAILDKLRSGEINAKDLENTGIKKVYNTFRNEFRKEDSTQNIISEILSKYTVKKVYKEGEEYLIEEQFIRNNTKYFGGVSNIPSMEQKIVLDTLLEISNNSLTKLVKQTRFGKAEIEEIGNKLNKYFHTKKYTDKKVMRLINLCFVITATSDEKYKILYIKSKH